MKKALPSLAVLAIACTLNAQTIQEYLDVDLVGVWDPGDLVQIDGGDHTLDANTTTPGLFESAYGQISGNTISREEFKAAVASAHANGTGGVIDFESYSYTGGDWQHPTAGTISREGASAMRAGNITIERGETWWFEGTYTDSPWGAYRGKTTPDFDGTGPSGPDRANWSEIFFFRVQSGSRLGSNSLGQTTSYDFDFDPADKVGIVGFAFLNYDGNYQSYQDAAGYAGYPNIHAIATFTNGSETVTQMSVGLSSQDGENDHFFGFKAPDGYYLDRLQTYMIGNNSRGFPAVDDLGFVQMAASDWYGYPIAELNWVDTDSWMGWVNITFDPWIWVESLARYVFVQDDSGWVYIGK